MKPILFSAPMVIALLDGRKTKTRRVIKFPEGMTGHYASCGDRDYLYYPCGIMRPKYQVGDVLWVRETWQRNNLWYAENDQDGYMCVVYKADGKTENVFLKKDRFERQYNSMSGSEPEWHPSIFMPKEATRIFLRVTSVHAERVQDISEADAKAEGIGMPLFTSADIEDYGYVECFEQLWNSINEKRGFGWGLNPFVWVYGFEQISKEEAERSEVKA